MRILSSGNPSAWAIAPSVCVHCPAVTTVICLFIHKPTPDLAANRHVPVRVDIRPSVTQFELHLSTHGERHCGKCCCSSACGTGTSSFQSPSVSTEDLRKSLRSVSRLSRGASLSAIATLVAFKAISAPGMLEPGPHNTG